MRANAGGSRPQSTIMFDDAGADNERMTDFVITAWVAFMSTSLSMILSAACWLAASNINNWRGR
jgi:hypothetical protein